MITCRQGRKILTYKRRWMLPQIKWWDLLGNRAWALWYLTVQLVCMEVHRKAKCAWTATLIHRPATEM